MTVPTIGRAVGGLGLDVPIDVERLLTSRMLMTANSGSGKSWALRRLLEQTHGKVQHLVVDPEGEFFTLRERFDYVLAGRGGEVAADTRSAALLARRLLELGTSAVLDLYELAPRDRVRFVRLFLESLIEAPKNLWHPVLVVIDEAHQFAPEKGHGEAESGDAVAALMSKGRKRAFCGVLATQRLSKLAKDVAAEANNVLIGRAALDVDLRRAGDLLGMPKADWSRIQSLKAGHFFAFGPAISDRVVELVTGEVVTSHPRAGHSAAPPPPPREKVQKVLAQLADLPKEAEQEAATIADARKQIAALQRDLKAAKDAQPTAVVERVEVPVVPDAMARRLEQVFGQIEKARDMIGAQLDPLERLAVGLRRQLADATSTGRDNWQPPRINTPKPHLVTKDAAATFSQSLPKALAGGLHKSAGAATAIEFKSDADLGNGVTRRMAVALAQLGLLSTRRLAMLAGVKRGGSTWRAGMAKLRACGYVEERGDLLCLTDAGVAAVGSYEPLPTGQQLILHWRGQLGDGAARRAFDVIVGAYPSEIASDELAETIGCERGGSTFRAALAKLRGLELIPRDRLVASDELFGDAGAR